MGADSARIPISGAPAPPPRPAPLPVPAPGSTLTRSAALTATASLVNYGAQLAVNVIVTPIVVRSLGGPLFGVWEMLRQAVGYMTATDGRPMDALRLVVASQQGRADVPATRRTVGAALVVWLLFLPLVVGAGALLIWITPTITQVGPELRSTIRATCALLVLGFLGGTLAAIPEAVLRGMNLGYKRLGWQAGLSIVGGGLVAAAAASRLGLPAFGAAELTLAGLTGLCFWILVKRYVPAFGVARPTRGEVGRLLGMSAWLTGGLVLTNALLASDVLILGMVVSPAVVATYVLTGAAARMAVSLFNFTVGAATPGLGGLLGQEEHARVAQVRAELVSLTWLFVTAVGTTILLWNRSFVSLWVGAGHYAGAWVNLLIVCVMVQTAFIRGDAFIIDAALRPRPRVVVTAVAAALTLAATLALTPILGIAGLCLGILLGRLAQTIAYPFLVASCLQRPRRLAIDQWARPAAVMAGAFAGAAYLGHRVAVHDWLAWLAAVSLTPVLVGGAALTIGLPAETRHVVLRRCAELSRAFRV